MNPTTIKRILSDEKHAHLANEEAKLNRVNIETGKCESRTPIAESENAAAEQEHVEACNVALAEGKPDPKPCKKLIESREELPLLRERLPRLRKLREQTALHLECEKANACREYLEAEELRIATATEKAADDLVDAAVRFARGTSIPVAVHTLAKLGEFIVGSRVQPEADELRSALLAETGAPGHRVGVRNADALLAGLLARIEQGVATAVAKASAQ